MTKAKKFVALLLSFLMAVPVFCISASADDAQNDPYTSLKEGTGYVAIGDSFTRGYGAGENWQNEIYLNDTYGNYNCRNVVASYPNLIAKEFGLSAPDDIRDTSAQFWPVAHDAVSTAYVLDLLGIEDGYRDDEFLYAKSYMTERYETDLRYFGDPSSFAVDGKSTYNQTGEVMSIREMIKNASLITVEVGQSDVIYKAQIFGFNALNLNDISTLPSGIANIISMLFNYFDYWKGAFPLLLDYIKEINPDAKVVLVGTMNPIKNATLTDDISIKIGNIINIIFDAMNTYTKLCAIKYGYMFVDISNVETPSAATQMSVSHILSISDDIEFGLQAHPTTKGYAQIAEKVIDAVKLDFEKDDLKNNFSIRALFALIVDYFKLFFLRFA